MSDEERHVDIENDAERRAYHNELERKRRDHIKESFSSLRDSVPQLHGEKVKPSKVSRAQILKKAADYITHMRRKNHNCQHDIEDLKRHNNILEQQIKSLEKNKCIGQFTVSSSVNARREGLFDASEPDSEERTHEHIATKKLKLTVM